MEGTRAIITDGKEARSRGAALSLTGYIRVCEDAPHVQCAEPYGKEMSSQ